jgi:pyruvate dehydrogenase E2 component (dihydrolipoamide acetyltransferase)
MPALSPTMSAGSVARWHVKEGQAVAPGDVLADIETDKATLAFENQEDGFIAKILVAEGARDVPVGQPVAVMVEDEAAVAAFASYGDASPPPSPSVPSPSPSVPSPPASLPPHVELAMPALSPTMDAGAIAAWHVKEGQAVSAGDVIADVETDKATLGFEVQDDGVIARILVAAGTRDIKVGTPVAIIVEDAALVPAFAGVQAGGGGGGGAAAGAAPAPPSSSAAAAAAAAASSSSSSSFTHNARVGPAVRFALDEAGLSLSDVPSATGPNGIVTKADVLAAVAAGVRPGKAAAAAATTAATAKPAAPVAAAAPSKAPSSAAKPSTSSSSPSTSSSSPSYTDVPNSQVRRVIATRLLDSKRTLPAAYCSRDVDVTAVTALRRELLAGGGSGGVKISLNDCVVRAAALALRAAPQANARWDEANECVRYHGDTVDVAVAVATEGGLITPIVRGADGKSLRQVAAEVRGLASRARQNGLKPEEYTGGTFTISNLGMYGLDSFSAIINPPQGAILAVGGAREEAAVVVGGGGEGGGGEAAHAQQQLEARSVMTATLSCDERAVGPDAAAAFLEAFAGFMARPASLLV